MIKRNRPRPNGGMRPHRPHQNGYSSNPNSKNDDNSELRLKNRGYYQQMYDKYSVAARESLSLGERIEAENHFQHAEHYLRQLNDRIRYDNEAQQQQQQRLQVQQAQQAQQLAQQQAQAQTQQVSQSPILVQTPTQQPVRVHSIEHADVAEGDVQAISVTGDEGEQAAPAQEKRPYRKRVLRTPHRRHVPQDAAASTPTDTVTPS
ncbi:MAG: DUF4167 domain-containing protein [Pseudomonadota bacterium]